MALTSYSQGARREPLYDVDPLTGISIEVFWADTTLEKFEKNEVGLFDVDSHRQSGRLPRALSSTAAQHRKRLNQIFDTRLQLGCNGDRGANDQWSVGVFY
jgi:hypothetical protein